MATLRITATFDDAWPAQEQRDALQELAADLRAALPAEGAVTRLAGLSLPGAPAAAHDDNRVFVCTLADGEAPDAVLRAVGGWHMRHGDATLALKADGPGGGVSLRLPRWSAVAFAAAAHRVGQLLLPGAFGDGALSGGR